MFSLSTDKVKEEEPTGQQWASRRPRRGLTTPLSMYKTGALWGNG